MRRLQDGWALLVRHIVVIALAAMIIVAGVAISGVAVLAVKASEQGDQLRTLLGDHHSDQAALNAVQAEHSAKGALNRGINVERWCEGEGSELEASSLNGQVRFNEQFVQQISGGKLSYKLTPLPCEQYVRETLEDKIAISKTSTPLVYKALGELPASKTTSEVLRIAHKDAGYRGP